MASMNTGGLLRAWDTYLLGTEQDQDHDPYVALDRTDPAFHPIEGYPHDAEVSTTKDGGLWVDLVDSNGKTVTRQHTIPGRATNGAVDLNVTFHQRAWPTTVESVAVYDAQMSLVWTQPLTPQKMHPGDTLTITSQVTIL